MSPEPLVPVRWSTGSLLLLTVTVVALMLGASALAVTSEDVLGVAGDALILVQLGILTVAYASPFLLVWQRARAAGVTLTAALGFRRFEVARSLAEGVGIVIVARLLNVAYTALLSGLGIEPPSSIDITRLFPDTAAGIAATVLLALVIAPLAEEALFRGVIYAGLRDRHGELVGLVVSSGVFAAFHFELYVFAPIFVLGLLLGRIVSLRRSLWPAVIAHALFNASALLVLYVLPALGGTTVGAGTTPL
ncbi:MAG: hypothetical protein Kow0067_06620 [Coriobacteriia bacterium]